MVHARDDVNAPQPLPSDSPEHPRTAESTAWSMYCPQCGRQMMIAREHWHGWVACPHCPHRFEPIREYRRDPRNLAMSGSSLISARSRFVAGVLGIFLGWVGVHRFYLGFVGIGLLQILVSLLTGGIGGALWGIAEGILCLTGHVRDADGLPLRD